MQNLLTELVADVSGAWGAAIGGLDGLVVEAYANASVDLSLLVAEHAGLMRAVNQAYEVTLSGGESRELFVRGERLSAYLVPIHRDFFLMLALDANANLGQARLYSAETARKLKETL